MSDDQQLESIVHPRGEFPDPERPHPGGGKFQRQRDAVQPTTDGGYGRGIARIDGEAGSRGGRSGDEQSDGAELR